MVETRVATGARPSPMGVPARFVGIITSPNETFQSVVAHPTWLGMLILVTLLSAVLAALPLTTDAGQDAALRTQVQSMESFGLTVSDQAYAQMRRAQANAAYVTAGSVLVVAPIMTLVFAGIFFAVFNGVLGGVASFRQLFAVVVHASAVSALQQIFTGPVNYLRGDVTSATNLAVLLPMLDDRSFAGRALAMTDLFLIWYLLVLAMGLAVLYKRRTQPIAITMYGIYAVGVLAVAAVMSRMGGA